MGKIRVAELFAGVGGFRIGLEGKNPDKSGYSVVWSNQWEPSTKTQHASDVYALRFGDKGHCCEDIAKVRTVDIPDHDLLVGGFPCQDYSVARTLSQAAGLSGKKGVLWWQIHRILEEKGKKAPQYLMLENVDRLLKSPASQRGRDFAVMLASLADLGYVVEWRIINAADYGMPQRRRRVYILGYKKGTGINGIIRKSDDQTGWLTSDGVMAKAFPVEQVHGTHTFKLEGDLADITKEFNKDKKMSPFFDAGMMIDRHVYTLKGKAVYKGKCTNIGMILQDEKHVSEEFYIKKDDMDKWKRQKGAKKEKRKSKDGFEYLYSEGAMTFPDALDKPSRTIVTGEGGATPSRFKHVIKINGKYRRLTPIELERLDMFPDNHTAGVPDARRAFFMGNALVVGVIAGLGKSLMQKIEEKDNSKKRK
ncbi:MAG: Cytosine-specific methyltransferase [Parcubacteria group bacterium GW2011_GWE2_38_18]|nr:MAG: Cytosine-specific methyltransferase [Parcubacteria group bacterium GW2011_GWE2_38_18]